MTPPEDKPKLRVSDWPEDPPAAVPARSTPPTPPAPSSGPAAPVVAPAVAAGGPGATPGPGVPPEAAAGGLDLPVDPLRLLGGVWQRRRWIVVGACIGALAATGFGLLRTKTRYQVSAQLIKREIPDTFRAGEIGEAFKPRTLSTATLVGLAASANVLRHVADRAQPPISLGELRRSVEVAEQRGTDYLFLTLSGYVSAPATVELANVWAEEVVAYTRDMQSRESREIRQYLQQELDANAAELDRVSKGLLDYNRREGLVSVDKQIDAQLRAIGDLDLRYETSRLEVDSINIKLRSLETELARQSPLADELKAARGALADVRTRFTDTNPVVLEAQDRVDQIEQRLTDSRATQNDDLSRFAGTFLGNTLYLQILDLRSQREALTGSLTELANLRDQARDQLNGLPAKELGIAQLTRNRRSLENTRDLLLSRLREAEVFEQRAPGYYQVFSPATLEAVIVSGKGLKVAVYGFLGLVLGCGGALAGALGLELLDAKLRTGAEAAKAWGAPLLATLPPAAAAAPATVEDLIARLWNRWLGLTQHTGRPQALWAPCPDPSEGLLWVNLLVEAQRLSPELIIVDTGAPDARPAGLATLPAVALAQLAAPATGPQRLDCPAHALSLAEANELVVRLRQRAATGRPVWIRLAGPVREPLTTIARGATPPLIIVPTGLETIPHWREQAARLRATGGAPCGIVALAEIPWHDR